METAIKDRTENRAPSRACRFLSADAVVFADQEADGPKTFKIVGYSGNVILNHWFWGNIAFDLQGIKFDKPRTPVLQEHDVLRRLGYSTKQEVDSGVYFEGNFLTSELALSVRQEIKDGFPMQASLSLVPTVIEHVADGETIEVNGHKLKGPGTVFRKSFVKEVSMCVFGADSKTSSVAAREGDNQEYEFLVLRSKEMSEEKKLTVEALTVKSFSEARSDLYDEIVKTSKQAGADEARELFTRLAELAPDDPAFVVDTFKSGVSLEEAKSSLIAKLRDKKPEQQTADKRTVDPAQQEFNDAKNKQGEQTDDEQKTFEQLVDERFKADTGGDSDITKKAKATRFVVKNYPKEHTEFLQRQKQEAEERAASS